MAYLAMVAASEGRRPGIATVAGLAPAASFGGSLSGGRAAIEGERTGERQ